MFLKFFIVFSKANIKLHKTWLTHALANGSRNGAFKHRHKNTASKE